MLVVQVQAYEYEDVPEGTGKGEWKRRQEGGVEVWVTGGERPSYSCSTDMMWGPDGGQRERSRCGQTEQCGWSLIRGVATGWRRGESGDGVGI